MAAASAIFCGGLVNVGASVQSETISATGTTSNPVLTVDNTDDATQLNKVISAAKDDKLVTKDNISGQLTDYAKASDLSAKADANDVYSKTDAENKFATKTELGSYAESADVYSKTDADGKFATKDALNDLKDTVNGKADKTYVDQKLTEAGTNVDNKLADYYNRAEVDGKITAEENARNNAITNAIGQERNDRDTAIETAINGEATARNQAINTAIEQEKANRDAAISTAKAELQGKITAEETERKEADTAFDTRLTTAEGKIGDNTTAIGDLKAKDIDLEGKITKNSQDITTLDGKVTTAEGEINNLKAKDIELEGRIHTNEGNIETNKNAIAAIDKRTAGIDRIDATNETTIEKNVTVDNLGNVTAKGDVNAGSLNVTGASDLKGNVTLGTPNGTNTVTVNGTAYFNEVVNMDKGLTVTSGDTKLKATTVDGKLTAGDAELKNTTVGGTLGVTGETTLKDKLTAKGEATFEKNVTAEKDLTVNGTLNTKDVTAESIHISKSEDTPEYKSEGSIIGEGGNLSVSNKKFDKRNNITKESQLNVNEEGTVNWATSTDATGNKTEGRSEVTADKIKNSVKKTEGGKTFGYEENITADGKAGTVTDKNGNTTYTKVTATENSFQVQDKDGKNKNHQVNTKDSSVTEITNGDGKTTKTEQTATDITNTAKDGTITNDANRIENKANTMDTNVTGKATESYGELETTVNGNETHTVTGNQDIHVTGKQTNTVGGGQENNISGGQKNNILTGDQETTVSNGSIINKAENGDISNTAKNVTNEGTESVTNKVGANEVKVSTDGVDIKAEAGKKITESVGTTSRVVENDKITDKAADSTVTIENGKGTTFGKEGSTGTTNIYGDSIKTGTINAKDTTTDKLTAGAAAGADGGRLTVDATDGVKGSYKSGDYTSKSYILANTLKSGVDNGKEPTEADFVGSRTDHYMDGDKAKLDETVKDADGSNVTNKTSTGTVTTITDGTTTTIIDQKKDSITSAVGDGTTSTVIKQDKDNVTIASSAGTVGIAGKDIINKATDTITNTAGTKITDTAGDSSVTTENGKGTTFTNTGANTAIGEGTVTDTTIKGNTITTGKVTMDYAEVMKDLGVHGNANITGKTTTGSLEVTGKSTLKGDVTMESNATVKKDLTVEGTTTTKTLYVTENATVGGTLDVAKKATFGDSVSIAKDLSVGGNATITGDVTAKSYKVGDKTYISADGINANDQKITNVADGSISEGSKDAVNGGQLYGMKRDLEHQVNKVGANAAAMANLHPMEFDPDSKWNIAAAIGNYGSETAAALGAFYRPNDDVMVNLSTAFGTGENMVGGGVSVRLGKGGNKLSREESNALKDQVNDLTARMDALLSVLNPNMSKDFPDVPENHWAYEAVSRLAGNDIVQGYPDGEFHGERTMTRYEMAEIIYNALSRGAEAEKELVEEFKPELQAMAASEKATAEKAEG